MTFEKEELSNKQEVVLDALTINKKISLFKVQPWVLVFTNQRLIVSVITPEMQKKAAKETKGYLNKIGIINQIQDRRRFLEMAPNEILSENPENFVIEYSQVSRIEFIRSSIILTGDIDKKNKINSPILKMKYGSEKIKSSVINIKNFQEFEDSFISNMLDLFGPKFSYK